MTNDLDDIDPAQTSSKYTPSVHVTPDFKRIYHLPRREWRTDPGLPARVERYTRFLRTPRGRETLFETQVQALHEIRMLRGGFIPALPGAGKTLLSLCQGTVLGTVRNMIIVPGAGGGVAKTRDEAREYAENWRIATNTILTYEKLQSDSPRRCKRCRPLKAPIEGCETCAELFKAFVPVLERYLPQSIFCDEADAVCNTDTARWRAIRRYLRKHPSTVVTFATGTFVDDSMLQFWHMLRAGLGADQAPVPDNWHEKNLWCSAMDVNPREFARPGALQLLSELTPGEQAIPDERRRARIAFRKRLTETPGVVATGEADIPKTPLYIAIKKIALPPKLESMLTTMRETRRAPNGDPIKFAIERWRIAQEMACGFYSVWDPPAPREWRDARSELNEFIAKSLERSKVMDKPSDVVRAIDGGRLPDGVPILAAWRNIRDTFRPDPSPIWIDDTPLHAAAEWLAEHPSTGLVWTAHTAVGHRLSELAGVPYFASKGVPTNRERFGKIRVDKYEASAIVSLAAIWKGFNLQRFDRNLYMSVPTTAKRWEQSMARTHRTGQTKPVSVQIMCSCEEHEASIAHAFARAAYVQDVFNQPQKLLYARNLIPDAIMQQVSQHLTQTQELYTDGETEQET